MDYNYILPKELIANEPVEPRDSARLLAYSTATDEIFYDTFKNVALYLKPDSLLVLNDTKVVPARIALTKITGGLVNVLFLMNEWREGDFIKGLPDKKVVIGDILQVDNLPFVEAISQKNEEFTFKILVQSAEFQKICREKGKTPLPPYIHSGLSENEARDRYQSVFAEKPASIAAPTASLHFTERVFDSLEEKGIKSAFVTLHVGRGTFSPVSGQMIADRRLHSEPIEISTDSAELIRDAKKDNREVISVGTTATRLLEAEASDILAGKGYVGETSLFITPPYEFKIITGMVTNFHLPNTSLIMLVDAFLQSKKAKKTWRALYEVAIKEKFRFYSFGDAMLVV